MATLGLHCCARALSRCGAQASHCSGFSHRGAQALAHAGSLTVGCWTGAHPRVGTRTYISWRRNHHSASHFTHIRKLKGSVSLNFQQTKQRYQFLWSHDGQNPGEIQELLKSAAQCHVETDSKWPDSSIPGFQQEVATLEAFWKSTFFIRIKIYRFNSKHPSYLQA